MATSKMELRIKRFLDYATHADLGNCDYKTYSEIRTRAIEEAKELGQKKSYVDAFKKRTVNRRSILNAAILDGLDLLPELLLCHLEADPSSNANDLAGRSSVHYVCQTGNLDLLMDFIGKYNVDLNATDKTGVLPLHLAILYGQAKTAYKMLKRLPVLENGNMFFGRSIHAAAFMDQIKVIKRIHKKFPEQVSIVISGFCTPPVCALYGDSAECLAYLWSVSPLMADRIVSKAVSSAKCQETALNRVTFLLENRADPNGIDEELCEDLAVIVAAKKRWRKVLEYLVPRTKAIDGVNWTAQGVINYVETPAFIEMDAIRTLNKVQTLKGRMIQELNSRNVFAALIICQSLKWDVNQSVYSRLQSLCNLYWELAISSSGIQLEVNVEALLNYALTLYDRCSYQLAMLAIDGCLALDPEDNACLLMREQIVREMAKKEDD